MNLYVKKTLAAGTAIAALLLNTGVAFAAADAEATVGDDGDAYSQSYDNDEMKIKIDNDAEDMLNVDAGVGLTGANFQFGGDDDSEITTGDAEGEGTSENFVNSTMGEVSDEEGDSAEADAEVGEDGYAEAYAYDQDLLDLFIKNHADMINVSAGVAVSGLNFQFCNDDGGLIDTGDSDATASSLNELNSTWLAVNGSHTATATATVGDDGDAFAQAYDDDTYKIRLSNDANLLNVSASVALSGMNMQFGTDDNSEIHTGSATASSTAENYLNSSVIVIGDMGGGAVATSSVGNDTAIDTCSCDKDYCNHDECLGSDAYAYDNDTVTVDVVNDANVTNISAAVAVSGGNVQTGSDDGGTIDTGDATGISTSTNTVNSTWFTIGDSDTDMCGEYDPCN